MSRVFIATKNISNLSFIFVISGTEDCVRVYSEAATREEADTLNKEVSDLVVQLCG